MSCQIDHSDRPAVAIRAGQQLSISRKVHQTVGRTGDRQRANAQPERRCDPSRPRTPACLSHQKLPLADWKSGGRTIPVLVVRQSQKSGKEQRGLRPPHQSLSLSKNNDIPLRCLACLLFNLLFSVVEHTSCDLRIGFEQEKSKRTKKKGSDKRGMVRCRARLF